MGVGRRAWRNAKTVADYREAAEGLIEELPNLLKILDNAELNEAEEVADKLDSMGDLPAIEKKLYDVVGDLATGIVKGVKLCAVCEKVITIAEVNDELGDEICQPCFEGFEEQSREMDREEKKAALMDAIDCENRRDTLREVHSARLREAIDAIIKADHMLMSIDSAFISKEDLQEAYEESRPSLALLNRTYQELVVDGKLEEAE